MKDSHKEVLEARIISALENYISRSTSSKLKKEIIEDVVQTYMGAALRCALYVIINVYVEDDCKWLDKLNMLELNELLDDIYYHQNYDGQAKELIEKWKEGYEK